MNSISSFSKLIKQMNSSYKKYTTSLFLAFALTMSTITIQAQQFRGGLLGGLSTNQIDGDTQKGYNKLGLFSGVFVETNFTKVVGAKVELYYIGKGAKQNIGGVEVFKTKLNYVEMPFLLKLEPIQKIVLDVGIAVSYLISVRQFEYGEEIPSSLIDLHNFDYSAIISGSYYFNDNWAFNARFDYSIVPIKRDHNWYNSNFSFGFLYLFN